MECFPPKIRNRGKISIHRTFLNIILEILDSAIRSEKEINLLGLEKKKSNSLWSQSTQSFM